LAELTHRCPLSCPYCSNPIELESRSAELDTLTWGRVFAEAAALGVLQLHLSGGEPTARADIVELTSAAVAAGLYTNLITSGLGLSPARLEALARAGLDHLQLSIQDVVEVEADRVAGRRGAYGQKREVARQAVALGLPLTINVVIIAPKSTALRSSSRKPARSARHGSSCARRNIMAGACETAPLSSPPRTRSRRLAKAVSQARRQGGIAIDYVAADHFAQFPKPCMHGWGRRSLNVTPSGKVLPCHAAETIPGLIAPNVRDASLADIWQSSPAFEAFRGTEWMRDPCASCARREVDFGGCRCQALAITGDGRNTDPACSLSPMHDAMREIVAGADPGRAYLFRARAPEA
jgi:pyrroloquinoline quinone biosynthesis protein E